MKTSTLKRGMVRMASILTALVLLAGVLPTDVDAATANDVTRITLAAIGDNGVYSQAEYIGTQ